LALLAAPFLATAQTADEAFMRQMQELRWLPAGGSGSVAGKAVFKASDAYTFLDASDTDKFLKLNGNPPSGTSYTIAPTRGSWFGILDFEAEGYVKDDESIDADALLKTLKKQNVAANEEKRKQGYRTLTLEGWAIPPRYDSANKRLEWGTSLRTEENRLVVNVSTRILGRSGFTSAILVTSPETVTADLADFKKALRDFDYVTGEKYSEWREGDRVAAYGLGALVLGGAAAAATSKGGFKAIGLALIAAVAALWGGIKKLVSRRKGPAL
jgi:uncharacterized membrane-anchored protein